MLAKKIINGKRISGSKRPLRAVSLRRILSLVLAVKAIPAMKPMPMPRYARPERPAEKPYLVRKTDEMVVKKRYKRP